MYQKVLKGIPGLTSADVETMLGGGMGLVCNWWRRVGTISPYEVATRLADPIELDRHLNRYGQMHHAKGVTHGQDSPYISTTAGVVQNGRRGYARYPAFEIAHQFATQRCSTDGCVFYCWVETAGRPAPTVPSLAEEIRDSNQYPIFYWYHHQGELTAKIHIPSVCIEKAELFSASASWAALLSGRRPVPMSTIFNPRYVAPEDLANVREIVG
jgi:hypothetical protein